MISVELTKDVEHAGLVAGDVIEVDAFSARTLIDRGDAKEYEGGDEQADAGPEAVKYGGQEVATIDDIVDPDVVRDRRVMTVSVVGAADPGPTSKTAREAEATGTVSDARTKNSGKAARGASGAEPRGGDSGGGS